MNSSSVFAFTIIIIISKIRVIILLTRPETLACHQRYRIFRFYCIKYRFLFRAVNRRVLVRYSGVFVLSFYKSLLTNRQRQ
jgi:hypothetical protein